MYWRILKLKRDQNRFVDAYERADFCPLGSAAMAGSNYEIDQSRSGEALGFRILHSIAWMRSLIVILFWMYCMQPVW